MVSKSALTYCEIQTQGDVRTVAPLHDPASALREFSVGTEVGGRYVIRYELGKGGMGCVFLAYDKTLTRDVALKVQLRAGDTEDCARASRAAPTATRAVACAGTRPPTRSCAGAWPGSRRSAPSA